MMPPMEQMVDEEVMPGEVRKLAGQILSLSHIVLKAFSGIFASVFYLNKANQVITRLKRC